MEEASALALVGVKERGVRVQLRLDSGAPWVLADRVQIQQVLLNPIRNAIEAMREGERRVLPAGRPARRGIQIRNGALRARALRAPEAETARTP